MRLPTLGAAGAAVVLLALSLAAPRSANAFLMSYGYGIGAGLWTQDFEYESVEGFEPDDYLLGLSGGFWLDLNLGPAWLVPRVEALYQQRGFREEGTVRDENGDTFFRTEESKLHYLTVPVTLRLQRTSGVFRPYVGAGLGAEFLLEEDNALELPDLDVFTVGAHVIAGIDRGRMGLQVRAFQDITNPFPGLIPAAEGDPELESIQNFGVTAMLTVKLGPL